MNASQSSHAALRVCCQGLGRKVECDCCLMIQAQSIEGLLFSSTQVAVIPCGEEQIVLGRASSS